MLQALTHSRDQEPPMQGMDAAVIAITASSTVARLKLTITRSINRMPYSQLAICATTTAASLESFLASEQKLYPKP